MVFIIIIEKINILKALKESSKFLTYLKESRSTAENW